MHREIHHSTAFSETDFLLPGMVQRRADLDNYTLIISSSCPFKIRENEPPLNSFSIPCVELDIKNKKNQCPMNPNAYKLLHELLAK